MAVPPWEKIRRRPVPVKAGWLQATAREPASLTAGQTLTAAGRWREKLSRGNKPHEPVKTGSCHKKCVP